MWLAIASLAVSIALNLVVGPSDSELKLVDVAIDESHGFPELDIKLRNVGGRIAFLQRVEINVKQVWQLEAGFLPFEVSEGWTYDVTLKTDEVPYKEVVPVAQAVPADGVDRFKLSLGNDIKSIDVYVFLITLRLVYDEDRKSVSSENLLFSSTGPRSILGATYKSDDLVFERNAEVAREIRMVTGVRSATLEKRLFRLSEDLVRGAVEDLLSSTDQASRIAAIEKLQQCGMAELPEAPTNYRLLVPAIEVIVDEFPNLSVSTRRNLLSVFGGVTRFEPKATLGLLQALSDPDGLIAAEAAIQIQLVGAPLVLIEEFEKHEDLRDRIERILDAQISRRLNLEGIREVIGTAKILDARADAYFRLGLLAKSAKDLDQSIDLLARAREQHEQALVPYALEVAKRATVRIRTASSRTSAVAEDFDRALEDDFGRALADYDSALKLLNSMPNITEDVLYIKRVIFNNRSVIKWTLGDEQGALEDRRLGGFPGAGENKFFVIVLPPL